MPAGHQVDGLEGERYDLVEPGQRAVVAAGGGGGHGNKRFADLDPAGAAVRRERGSRASSGWIELRLRLLADAGLVGLPNAGKSSLLGRLTRAAPKVADYPFTTIDPVLGTLEADDRQLVLADIPGLIEGAAEGAGLGDEFLAHVERCRALRARRRDGAAGGRARPGARLRDRPRRAGGVRRRARPRCPSWSCSRSATCCRASEVEAAAGGVARSGSASDVLGVLAVSSATGEGLDELRAAILAAVPSRTRADPAGGRPRPGGRAGEFEAEHITYRPGRRAGLRGRARGRRRLPGPRPRGRAARRAATTSPTTRRSPTSSSGCARSASSRRSRSAGFEPGDEVRIGEEAFELDPRLTRLTLAPTGRPPFLHSPPMTVVAKLGSSIVAAEDGELRADVLDAVCAQVAELHAGGENVALVTSGAIALRDAADGAARARPQRDRRAPGRLGGRAGHAVPRLRGAARGARRARRAGAADLVRPRRRGCTT